MRLATVAPISRVCAFSVIIIALKKTVVGKDRVQHPGLTHVSQSKPKHTDGQKTEELGNDTVEMTVGGKGLFLMSQRASTGREAL